MNKKYRVVDDGVVRYGSAQEILSQILAKTSVLESDFTGMDVDAYADALIRGADYHLPKNVADAFDKDDYPTKYDKALQLLNILPASGTSILPVSDQIGPKKTLDRKTTRANNQPVRN